MYKKVPKEIISILPMAIYLILSSSLVQFSHAQPNQDMKAVLDIHNQQRALVGALPLT